MNTSNPFPVSGPAVSLRAIEAPHRSPARSFYFACAFLLLGAGVGAGAHAQGPRVDLGVAPAASETSETRPSAILVDAPSALLPQPTASAPAAASALDPASSAKRKLDHEEKVDSEIERNTECEDHTLRGRPCRVSWVRILPESLIFLAAQHGGNIWMDDDTRNQLTHGNFWAKYIDCVDNYRWSRWKDDDPFGVDYIGHPMMGAITSSIYEQNDPKQRALTFENTKRYWMGRLRAMAYSAAYSAQWKVGPASEASIGNTGIGYYVRKRDGIYTNETGMQDFFVTPIGGFAWNVGEDAIDRYILSHVRHGTKNKATLFLSSLATPCRSAANITRFRAPYYRDMDDRSASLRVQ